MKFILVTNNEENFINITSDDIRYWVIKVPPFKQDEVIVDILEKMKPEIPYFLRFLIGRKLSTEKESRMHFHPDLFKNEELRKLVENSQPTIEKDIRHFLKELFLDTGDRQIEMSLKVIHKAAINNKFNASYLEKILKNNLKLLPYHVWVYNNLEYPTKEAALTEAGDQNEAVQIKFKTKRYSFPHYQDSFEEGKTVHKIVYASDVGRPYLFRREDFINAEEDVEVVSDIAPGFSPLNSVDPDELPFPIK